MYDSAVTVLRPLVLAWLFVAVALIALWRRPGKRRRLGVLTAGLVLLYVVCLPITSRLALGTLEWSFPPPAHMPADISAIVVLAGSLRPTGEKPSRFEPGTDTLYRCLRAVEVYRSTPRPIVVSGGKVHATDPDPPPAVVMHDFLLAQGVRPEHLIVEAESQTTYENAAYTARLLRESGAGTDGVLLVTDAAHLRRARACFQKQGLDVIALGCRYRATNQAVGPGDFVPDSSAPVGVEEAAHEWLGLLWYWLTDRL
jgi:uncharacterized SAM-binding protein YcdF (DUF218 family)